MDLAKEMALNTLNIGFIKPNWRGNEDEGSSVEIGNPHFSEVLEVTVSFSPSEGTRLMFQGDDVDPVFGSGIDSLFDDKSDALNSLARYAGEQFRNNVPAELLACAIRVVAQGSGEWQGNKAITFITEDGPEIADATPYRGQMYVHYFDSENEKDSVIAVRI